jgi:GH15 family glucan-1,4-alpha-glucosidase
MSARAFHAEGPAHRVTHPHLAPYPPLERHGLIGDRRTAALVSADGCIDWLCAPGWDGEPLFGALLDADRGGHFRLGPRALSFGTQRYLDGTAVLVTRWPAADCELELTDAMELPGHDGAAGLERRHVVVRRLHCLRGHARCTLSFQPKRLAHLWTSHGGDFELKRGETAWAVLDLGGAAHRTAYNAQHLLDATMKRWREWTRHIHFPGPRAKAIRTSGMLVHLLDSAPYGSLVAAPTTSLPERIGGDWQADYRLAWIRDASLAAGCLASLGQIEGARRYLDWISGIRSSELQPVYAIGGGARPVQHPRTSLYGFRGSLPVRVGNHAWHQRQPGSAGFLADCMLGYLERGGRWCDDYWRLIERVADNVVAQWSLKDNGIWELTERRHFVSSRVMCWVALDRALRIAAHLARAPSPEWSAARDAIFDDVIEHGWSTKLGSFRQSYEAHELDAALLLIPVMGFLPPQDERVRRTVARIAEELTLDGFVYRFKPESVAAFAGLPMGEAEGAFLPCTFWLACAWALEGDVSRANALLERAEAIAGPLGLFAEAVDPRTKSFRGNGPLLFSQVEYVRAVLALRATQGGRRWLEEH